MWQLIQFMRLIRMIVRAIESKSNKGYIENICKSMLLRKTSFLKFSLNSIFSLLSGVSYCFHVVAA